jgi:acyl-homoserine-lactone acylase
MTRVILPPSPGAATSVWRRADCACGLVRTALATLALLALGACATPPPPRSVSISRTSHGVAHVQAGDLGALAHGVAYAHAQDNVCQTADVLLTVRAERSRHFGAAATGLLGLRRLPNEQIDVFVQAHMDDAALAAAWAQGASADARAMAQGYVDGYNRYLREHAADLPAACRAQPWLRPMTLADYHRLTELSVVQAGVAALADAVIGAAPPVAARVSAPAALPAELSADQLARGLAEQLALWRQDGEAGSNGWAFGAAATRDGRGLLLGNPHFPWTGPNRFWQMHLVVPGQLDVMGAAIGHGAVVQIGFNRDVAWTHTVSTGRRFTLHALTLVPGDPTRYLVDGQPEAMTARRIEIQVLGDDGRLTTRSHTVWTSRYGPLVVLPRAGLTWTTERAWALKDANTRNVRAADTWLAFNRARSVADLRSALAGLGLPWVNTIATDRHGQALYADVSVVPDVNADRLRQCAPLAGSAGMLATAGLALLDGSRSACDWAPDPASPVPGLTPMNRLPVLQRRDFVQNSNDSYWLSNPEIRPAGISPLVGPTHVPQRLRTRAGLWEIGERLGGRDGLAPDKKIALAELQAMFTANRNYAAHLVLDDLLGDCRRQAEQLGASSREACSVLAGWDRSNRADARGAHLFREWWRAAKDIKDVWRRPFNPEDAVATPAGLNLDDAAVRREVYAALDAAVATLRSAGVALDAPLGQVQQRVVGGRSVAIPGGDEFEGVLNKVETQGQARLAAGGYAVNFGSSYLQAVGFDEAGPVAHGLLSYGQSSDPGSPWAYDQLDALGRTPWPALPYHAADVARARIGPVLVLSLP